MQNILGNLSSIISYSIIFFFVIYYRPGKGDSSDDVLPEDAKNIIIISF